MSGVSNIDNSSSCCSPSENLKQGFGGQKRADLRGVFRNIEELIAAIFDYIDLHNENPKPFIWTAKAADVLEKVKRARIALHNRQSA